ncbi:MAG: putative DNA binding domain-containing protein, partial [Thiomargarita sp.]|nr:putative DNA binding domain-containing protein [Thiomargarita sp.]
MTLDELKKLLQFPENEHVEYKEAQTQYDLKKLMKYCVAFANEKGGKLIFGVNDHRKIVGTQIFKNIEKIKSDIFDKVHIVVNIFELQEGNKRVLVFDILSRPPSTPVDYEGAYFMRIGEETRTMSAEKLRGIFEEGQSEFESQLALQNITGEQVVLLLDVQSYFDLMNLPLPKTQEAILDRFIREKLVSTDDLSYSITNMGAILFAKDVNKFEWIARKAVRLVVYDGNGKLNTKQDITGIKGYAVAFQSLIEFIMGQIPTQEVIMDDGLRQKKREYPKLSIRELVANALIHQDFKSRGNNVMIEIYDNRIEISNPGKPVIP